MSWLSDSFADIKILWQRFEQWERFALLREREWQFPIYGAVDEFERCFKHQVFQVSRDDFFRLNGWREDHIVFGFCLSNEVTLKVPSPPINCILIPYWSRPVYHFHGTLVQRGSELYLYGHNRADRLWVNWWRRAANFYYLICAAWLIASAVALGLGLPMDAETEQQFGSIVQPLFVAGIWTLYLLISAHLIEGLARPVHTEAHRILADICGSPSESSSNHSE